RILLGRLLEATWKHRRKDAANPRRKFHLDNKRGLLSMKRLCRFLNNRPVIISVLLSILVIGCSVGHTQSNTQPVSNGSIRVGEEQLRAAIITKDSNGGILIPEMKTTLRCISILSEIPEELRDE